MQLYIFKWLNIKNEGAELEVLYLNNVILGNLPFIGVSYRGHHQELSLQATFSSTESVLQLLQAAYATGIRRFAIQVPENEQMQYHWNAMLQLSNSTPDISVIPNISIPLLLEQEPLEVYRRWATVIMAYGEKKDKLLNRVSKDVILKCRPNWETQIVEAISDKLFLNNFEIEGISLATKTIETVIDKLSAFDIEFLEFGSEVDFLVASNRLDLIEHLIEFGRSFGHSVGFGVHHAGLSLPKLDKIDGVVGILTPVNHEGIMMFPSQQGALSAIENLQNLKKRLIAIKTLGGGNLTNVQRSISNLKQQNINQVMIGISSSSELVDFLHHWNN